MPFSEPSGTARKPTRDNHPAVGFRPGDRVLLPNKTVATVACVLHAGEPDVPDVRYYVKDAGGMGFYWGEQLTAAPDPQPVEEGKQKKYRWRHRHEKKQKQD